MDYCYDVEVWGNRIRVEEDGLFWLYEVEEGKAEEASHIMDDAIGHWYNCEDYPEYESLCIGDVFDIELEEAGILYSYLEGGELDER